MMLHYLKKIANAFLMMVTFPLIIISKLENLMSFLANLFKPFQVIGQNVLSLFVNLISPCVRLGTALGELYVRSQTGVYTVGKVLATKLYELFYMTGKLVWDMFVQIARVLHLTNKLQGNTSSKRGLASTLKRSS